MVCVNGFVFPPNTLWLSYIKLVDSIQLNIYWAPMGWTHLRNTDEAWSLAQGLRGVTVMFSPFLRTPWNIQGVNGKLMVTFALSMLRKRLRIYPLFPKLDFGSSFEKHCNHCFSVLTITKQGHFPKQSFKMSENIQLLKNSVIARSSLQNHSPEFKDFDYPLRTVTSRLLPSPFNETKYSHKRQLQIDLLH